jgi:PDZ domain-containing protein
MRWFSPARLAVAGLVLLGAAALVLWLAPAHGYDIQLVDPAHRVDPLVTVQGEKANHPPSPIYFVDVREREARLLERLLPFTRPSGSSVVPAPPGISSTVEQQIGRQDMTESQKVAAVVALNHLGYKVHVNSHGVIVVLVEPHTPAAKILKTSDTILEADGKQVTSVNGLRAILAKHKPGDKVTIVYRRGGQTRTATIKTVPDPQDPKQALVGISARDDLRVKLPVKVSINAAGVGGPSAGLAFALDILQELGRNVTHGHRVAATGELALDGTVLPIGGVKQKTLGVRAAGVDVFLVPAGENAQEARRYGDGVRIIPVKNFPQALRALQTLR